MKAHDGPHKYIQAKFKTGTLIFKCGIPGCPHFVYEPLIVGRISICWRCDGVFVITGRSVRSKKLHCEGCTRFQKVRIPEEMSYDIERLVGTVEDQNKEKRKEQLSEMEKTNLIIEVEGTIEELEQLEQIKVVEKEENKNESD